MPNKQAPAAVERAQRRNWATTNQTARHLKCSERTVRRMIADGTIAAYRVHARLLRIDLAEVDAALAPIPSAATPVRER